MSRTVPSRTNQVSTSASQTRATSSLQQLREANERMKEFVRQPDARPTSPTPPAPPRRDP